MKDRAATEEEEKKVFLWELPTRINIIILYMLRALIPDCLSPSQTAFDIKLFEYIKSA